MAMVTFTHPSKTNLEKNNNHLCDASFSSYLNSAKQAFVFKLVEPNQNFNPFITNSHESFYLGRKKIEEDEELGIFNADKYFNGGMDKESPKNTKSTKKFENDKDESSDLVPAKTQIHPGTPSVRSETSWNSQIAFLKSALRDPNPPRRKTKKVLSKTFITILGCNYCSCNDKNSIDTNEHVSERKASKSVSCGEIQEPIKNGLNTVDLAPNDELGNGLKREENFNFPLMKSKKLKEEEDGKPRKSLEVFGSPILEKGKKTLSLERKFTMLNWDSTPRVDEIKIPPNSEEYNDTESDASSDLFEIESFTNIVTPRTCYAPSEASIEWSVVTASSAVMSDSEELRKIAITNGTVRNEKTQPIKEIHKKRPSLLGCKSQKAVRIAGDAHITSEKAVNDPRKGHGSMTRFQAETNLTGFDSGIRRQTFNGRSASASRLLYIQ